MKANKIPLWDMWQKIQLDISRFENKTWILIKKLIALNEGKQDSIVLTSFSGVTGLKYKIIEILSSISHSPTALFTLWCEELSL